jgi:hypothetical protein
MTRTIPRKRDRETRKDCSADRNCDHDHDQPRSSRPTGQQLLQKPWAARLTALVVGILGVVLYIPFENLSKQLSFLAAPSSPTTKTFGGESVPPERRTMGKKPIGSLRPYDLPGPAVFDGFDEAVGKLVISVADEADDNEDAKIIRYREGKVLQINQFESTSVDTSSFSPPPSPPVFSTVTLFPRILPRSTIQKMLELLREDSVELDVDPDTVDGMPTYEVFVDSVELRQNQPSLKTLDNDYYLHGRENGPDVIEREAQSPRHYSRDEYERRRTLRAKLQNLTRPAVELLTEAVRARHPDLCNITEAAAANHRGRRRRRMCTPCYSLIRRYRWGERTSHPPHYDGHARVTVVVSLSDYEVDYTGGLYMSTGHGPQREFLNMSMGDAVLHPSTLLHGVHVYPSSRRRPHNTERWSWILWFRDSEECEDLSIEWFAECANQGNPLCLQFQASKLVQQYEANESAAGVDENHPEEEDPSEAQLRVGRRVMELNMRAAEKGAAEAAVKVARAYLKQLPSELEFNIDEAKRFFRLAIRSHSSEGHYGLASILVAESNLAASPDQQQDALRRAVSHLERAAMSLHAYGCFNLGIAHIFGYGVPRVDMELGVEWLVQSGLPEGYILASQYAATIGDQSRHDEWLRQALILGWDQPWRVQARQNTGSGGAAGVDLNLMWPPSIARGGIQPPQL